MGKICLMIVRAQVPIQRPHRWRCGETSHNLKKDRQSTISEIISQLGLSLWKYRWILREDLNMWWIFVKFVPWLLTDKPKQQQQQQFWLLKTRWRSPSVLTHWICPPDFFLFPRIKLRPWKHCSEEVPKIQEQSLTILHEIQKASSTVPAEMAEMLDPLHKLKTGLLYVGQQQPIKS
jgi:hypothetical protein